MADSNTNGIEKGASDEITVPESQSNPPTTVKEPVNVGKESTVASIATNTSDTNGAAAPNSESASEKDATTSSKEELTEKSEGADKLASQPEEPADSASAPVDSTRTETTTADASSLVNGEAKEPPKPVSIEEVHDQDMPAAALSQPAKVSDIPLVENAGSDAPKADPAPVTTESGKPEVNTGEKRKPSEAEASNGSDAPEEALEDAPAEKKQKTNGATTNGLPKKAGRPKKNKTAAPAVGRAARKTRSQGAAD
ncbi:uncharacterized protein GGS25DRAFT_494124 [Hypoxylon fragiforme]|uniref:uncharacterized protein n=1 Tax=Hypoxylon fragiforme TaxID=63214 RepID=UPI0020C705A5|nr:uncharacterized protein GGS25DRAFT_494124 [Hypoxylon fragiforme]KAI2607026.1 hypothetical protein GGS25DRAFT_494124 [Hypoxylon fragiforme]